MTRILSGFAATALLVGCNDPVGCYANEYKDGGYCLPLPVDSGMGAATAGEAGADPKNDGGATDGAGPSGSVKPDSSVVDAGELEGDAGLEAGNSSEPDGAAPEVDGAAPTDDAAQAEIPDGGPTMAPPACVPTTEECDGRDNNCDGKVDEGVKTRCWSDADGDGYAAAGAAVVESCDACGAKQTAQEPVAGKADCDDVSAAKSPGATDICGDSIDNDCDGKPDDDNNNTCGGPCTAQLPGKPGDGCNNGQSGACARPGVYECRPDHTMACTAPMVPATAAEVCGNGKDDDCKNGVDDGCVMNACRGWTTLMPAVGGSCMVVKGACSYPGKYVCAPGSTDATVCGGQPPAENCSTAADDNCDGRANEGCCVPTVPPTEVCGDGKDNDCNGKIDDGKNECGMACGSTCPPPGFCGDGVVGIGEECDPRSERRAPFFCSATCARISRYMPCQNRGGTDPACLGGTSCNPNGICSKACSSISDCDAVTGFPDIDVQCPVPRGTMCVMRCIDDADCAPGALCNGGQVCESAS